MHSIINSNIFSTMLLTHNITRLTTIIKGWLKLFSVINQLRMPTATKCAKWNNILYTKKFLKCEFLTQRHKTLLNISQRLLSPWKAMHSICTNYNYLLKLKIN